MQRLPKPIQLAKTLVAEAVRPDDFVLDGTIGNGHDSLFLAGLLGDGGRLLGFDVQAAALEATRQRLTEAGVSPEHFELRLESHAVIADLDLPPIGAAMFNFGYLPGSDKSLITQRSSSLAAIRGTLAKLRSGGRLSLMCYPGHEGGPEECQGILDYVEDLDGSEVAAFHYREISPQGNRPFLILLAKK